ncbi:MAG: hypothetical protein ACRDHD_10100, partial [Candidatus Limnocylindria bacterium]
VALAGAVAALVLASVAVLAAMGAWDGRGVAAAPSVAPTPEPTADWLTPLLDGYAAACDEPLPATQLASLEPSAARQLVDRLAEGCAAQQAQEDEDDDERKGKGRGRGRGGDD